MTILTFDPNLHSQTIAEALTLGAALEQVRALSDNHQYELVAHWKQGEFHHDVVVAYQVAGGVYHSVIATNCNGGVKEVLLLENAPERYGLWRWRCPDNPEFHGAPPALLARATTVHDFDPCSLLLTTARSELLPAHRERDVGGGWRPRCKASSTR